MGILVLPLIELQAALNQEWTAFFHVLSDDLGLTPPGFDINERYFFFCFAAFAFPSAIHRHTYLRDGSAFRGVTQLWVASEVSGENNSIKTGHRVPFSGCGGLFRGGGVGEENAENIAAHRKAVLELLDEGGLAFEDDIHVKTRAVLLIGHAAEGALVHFLHRLDLASERGDLAGN